MSDTAELLPNAILRRAAARMESFSNSNARRDAEIMLAHVLDIEITQLPLKTEAVSSVDYSLFEQMVERRCTDEPVAYITGRQSFWSFDFRVNEHTLIPRPDTEILVEVCIAALKGQKSAHILDIGTGSGCILLSILSEVDGSTGIGIDVSDQALAIATENAFDNNLNTRASFMCGDMLAPIEAGDAQSFDLIVSNPPYIPTRDIDDLMHDVKDYEPLSALDGGNDGYDFYRILAVDSLQYLKKGGTLAVEVGFGQAAAVSSLFQAAGFKEIMVKQDLNGIDRVVSGKNS